MDSEDARAAVQALVDDHGFLSWLDVAVESVGKGAVVLRVPFDETLVNDTVEVRGGVHGGVASTLADTAGGIALRTVLDDPLSSVATIDLNVSYLQPARADLVATADVVRAGTTVGVARVDVEAVDDGERTLVAAAQGSYRLFRGEE